MKHITLYFLLLLNLSSCSAQKDTVQIKEVALEEVEKDLLFLSLDIKDYDLKDKIDNLQLTVNKDGLYQFKDSRLVDAEIKIWLHEFSEIDKDVIADCEEPPIAYGYLEGKIIDGKKEGKWFKKIKTPIHPHYIIVKVLHYTNGFLNGKYQVYDTNSRILHPIDPHPLYPDEYRNYTDFKEGTGLYYDYYYSTGILKEKGFYLHGKKHSVWLIYDRKGYPIKKSIYNNGVLLND
ncbi:toxin-antitoxin system YwqK family antitoxin [Aquimarina aquimarini]|uniref:toxin-antitoxin system YwqK family antitoxin n=1 Tax=Aquimarina aquimarini TaxID=1191734 RepID=UPI001F2D698F|nr:hypothetical protein [Aquimarina aquimarini]